MHRCQTILPNTIITRDDWRPYENCTKLDCELYNAHYDPCGSSCINTCTMHNISATDCNLPCIEGCQCNDGYVVDNMQTEFRCIKLSECRCRDADGILHNR